MDKVTGQCPQTTTFLKRKESRSGIEPRFFRLPALPLGQTGSPYIYIYICVHFRVHFYRTGSDTDSVGKDLLCRDLTEGKYSAGYSVL